MKYIILDVPFGDTVRRTPILFPNYLTHAIVSESLQAHPTLRDAKVYSAGEFSSVDLRDVDLHGRSTSLGVESLAGDSDLLPMLDYTHGII